MSQQLLADQGEITSWPPKGKLCICIFPPYQLDDVGSQGIGANEKKGKSCKGGRHVGKVAVEGDRAAIAVGISVKVIHDGINIL